LAGGTFRERADALVYRVSTTRASFYCSAARAVARAYRHLGYEVRGAALAGRAAEGRPPAMDRRTAHQRLG
jgi:hypothetical protein